MKQLGIFLVFVVLSTAILSFLMPTGQKIERSVQIQAPAAAVYQQIAELESFNKWSVWAHNDSTLKNTITGQDGTVGAVSQWKGDPTISGEGRITILKLEAPSSIEQELHFMKPHDMKASSRFTLTEANGITTVTWTVNVPTPRPWNIFNLFHSMDKEMGKDFDQGLNNLKQMVEKKAGVAAPAYTVSQINFTALTFDVVRQEIGDADRNAFLQTHFNYIKEELQKKQETPGALYGLIYKRDAGARTSDIGAAVALSSEKENTDNGLIKTVSLASSKAIAVDYYGDPANAQPAYFALENYLREQKLEKKMPVIEEYKTAYQNQDTARWHTRVIYLVD
ncbi:SRPBCC family protein [Nostoc ellipsosporum NOK]|nr:SRPBCC family protein [Nostoc ellipsosporum NOK]